MIQTGHTSLLNRLVSSKCKVPVEHNDDHCEDMLRRRMINYDDKEYYYFRYIRKINFEHFVTAGNVCSKRDEFLGSHLMWHANLTHAKAVVDRRLWRIVVTLASLQGT